MKQAKIVFFDIETAPTLAWVWRRFKENIGLDQVVHDGWILCGAWKWLGCSEVHTARANKAGWMNTDDRDVTVALWKVLDEADIVVAHNGKDFDVPLMNAAFVRHGLPPPSPYKVVDTKEEAKKAFRFPSNKLEGLCRFFGFGGKHKTEFTLWTRCIDGDEVAWDRMVRYCACDVVKLERVYKKLLPFMTRHPNVSLYTDDDRPTCPKCNSKHIQWRGKKSYRTATSIYSAFQCQSCGGWGRGQRNGISTEKRRGLLVSTGQ